MGTGIWLVLRYIFLKDKKDIAKQKIFLDGIGLFSAGSVLNMANTLFYILAPVAFMAKTNMTVGTVLGLDSINIVLMLGDNALRALCIQKLYFQACRFPRLVFFSLSVVVFSYEIKNMVDCRYYFCAHCHR